MWPNIWAIRDVGHHPPWCRFYQCSLEVPWILMWLRLLWSGIVSSNPVVVVCSGLMWMHRWEWACLCCLGYRLTPRECKTCAAHLVCIDLPIPWLHCVRWDVFPMQTSQPSCSGKIVGSVLSLGEPVKRSHPLDWRTYWLQIWTSNLTILYNMLLVCWHSRVRWSIRFVLPPAWFHGTNQCIPGMSHYHI